MIPIIEPTEIKIEVSSMLYDVMKGMQAVCDMYASCEPKQPATYTIDTSDRPLKVILRVPVTLDGNMLLKYEVTEGDILHCVQRHLGFLPVIHITPGIGGGLC